MKKKTALRLVQDELKRACEHHAPMNSPHEGYAVIKEELEELWKEIKADQGITHRGVSEAVQTAAMALRYLVDLCEEPVAAEHEAKVDRFFEHDMMGRTGGGCYSG